MPDKFEIPPGVKDPSRRIIHNPTAGETGHVLEYSYETSGERTVAIAECVPGGGPPVHYHRCYSETFEAMEGDLTLIVGDAPMRHLKAGEVVTVPAGTLHKFGAGEAGARFKVTLEPGQPGFEKSIYILFGLARDGLLGKDCLPRNPVYTAVVGTMGDMYFPGALGAVINGASSVLAAYARWMGIEQQLLEKYWL